MQWNSSNKKWLFVSEMDARKNLCTLKIEYRGVHMPLKKTNWIVEILSFNHLLLTKPLSTGQIALWHALMQINNDHNWATWFPAANMSIESLTSLSRQGIVKNRNALKQAGLLDFRTNGTKATKYCLTRLENINSCDLAMSNSLQVSLQDEDTTSNSLQDGLQDSLQKSSTYNKTKTKIKTKIKTLDSSIKKTFEELQPLFDDFWKLYPRKENKDKALKAFLALSPSEAVLESMFKAIETQSRSEQWTEQNGKYIPHASNWIDGRRWEDKPVVIAENTSPHAAYNLEEYDSLSAFD